MLDLVRTSDAVMVDKIDISNHDILPRNIVLLTLAINKHHQRGMTDVGMAYMSVL